MWMLLKMLMALCLFACLSTNSEDTPRAHGGGSDTETLTGLVLSSDGKPAARTLVKLIPSDFDPSQRNVNTIRFSTTNDSGKFKFEKVDSLKTYNVITGNSLEKKWAISKAVTLKKAAAAKGLVITLSNAKVFLFSLHTSVYETKDSGIAYFPGTDILTHCDGINTAIVDSVPLGALHFAVQSRAGWAHDTTLVSVPDTLIVKAQSGGITYGP